jgi:predicted TIM-barrel fold metal-dependent hydrolase
VHSQIVNPIGFERVKDPLLTPVIEYVFDTTISAGKLLMSDVLRNYPKVKFVFAYFGGAICYLKQRFDATYQMLRGLNFVKDLQGLPSEYFKNIYVDTSGDTTRANFLLSLDLMGPKRILWGSDWPAKQDIAAGIKAVNDLDISQEEKQNILGGNAAKLFVL